MAASVERAIENVIPNLQPLRAGLSLMAGATVGSGVDLLSGFAKKKGLNAGYSGPVLPFVVALMEGTIAAWTIDMAGDYLSGSNTLFFTLGAVQNLTILETYGDSIAMMLGAKL